MYIRNLIAGSLCFIILTSFFVGGIFSAFQIEKYIRIKVDAEVSLRLNSREKHATIVVPFDRGYYSPNGRYENHDGYYDEEGPHPQGKVYSDEDKVLSGEKPTDLIR